jgi:hypothetical protein
MSHDVPAVEVGVRPVGAVTVTAPVGLLRAAWDRWKKIARAVGVVQTRILMVVFFFIFVLPLGLIVRLRSDPLHLRPPEGSNWTPHRDQSATLDTARRQF